MARPYLVNPWLFELIIKDEKQWITNFPNTIRKVEICQKICEAQYSISVKKNNNNSNHSFYTVLHTIVPYSDKKVSYILY